jgi:hypothetical protein
VVVPYCTAAGVVSVVVVSVEVVSVVVVSVEVEASSVVVAAVVSVLVEDAPVPSGVEVESIVETTLVAPVRTLTAPPNGLLGSATAPEAKMPSAKIAVTPATIFALWPRHFD